MCYVIDADNVVRSQVWSMPDKVRPGWRVVAATNKPGDPGGSGFWGGVPWSLDDTIPESEIFATGRACFAEGGAR